MCITGDRWRRSTTRTSRLSGTLTKMRGPLSSSRNDSGRSEEHTSELQSPCNLVCRLLLEKKKNYIILHIASYLHVVHSSDLVRLFTWSFYAIVVRFLSPSKTLVVRTLHVRTDSWRPVRT